MNDDTDYFQKMAALGFHEGAHLVKAIDAIDFAGIKSGFKPRDKRFPMPRIAFLGLYRYLSMTDQRHICQGLGFEYVPEVGFGVTNQQALSKLTAKWRDITASYTKAIIIGDASTDEIRPLLYKSYQRDDAPIFIKHEIPVLFESELVKLHPDYPVIDSATSWKNIRCNYV